MTFHEYYRQREPAWPEWTTSNDERYKIAGQVWNEIACCGACEHWYSIGGIYDCNVDPKEQYTAIDADEPPCELFEPRRKG